MVFLLKRGNHVSNDIGEKHLYLSKTKAELPETVLGCDWGGALGSVPSDKLSPPVSSENGDGALTSLREDSNETTLL